MLELLHNGLANTAMLFCTIAGLWGLVTFLRRRGVTPNYWGILVIGQILFLVQGLLGVLMWLEGERPARSIHLVFGAVATMSIPTYYALSKGRADRWAALTYGVMCVALVGIAMRATITGRFP